MYYNCTIEYQCYVEEHLETSVQKQHKSIKHTFGKTSSKFANEKAYNFYVNVNICR